MDTYYTTVGNEVWLAEGAGNDQHLIELYEKCASNAEAQKLRRRLNRAKRSEGGNDGTVLQVSPRTYGPV